MGQSCKRRKEKNIGIESDMSMKVEMSDSDSLVSELEFVDFIENDTDASLDTEIGKPAFYPWWFLPAKYRPFCDLEVIMDSAIKMKTPPEIPCWREPSLEPVPIGLTLEAPNAYNVARLMPKLTPNYYEVIGANGDVLGTDDYIPEFAYNNEKKKLACVLRVLNGHLEEIDHMFTLFGERMREWRADRRSWEVNMANELSKTPGVFWARFDLTDLNNWLVSANEQDSSKKGDIWSHWDYTGLEVPKLSPEVPPQHMVGNTHAKIAHENYVQRVTAAIEQVNSNLTKLKGMEGRERAVIDFDADDNELSDSSHSDRVTIPVPPRRDREKFYYWCIERHGSWAKKGTFKEKTMHKDYQLATLTQLVRQTPANLFKGNLGLIDGLVHHVEDLKKYPWGLPAATLYQAMKFHFAEHRFFNMKIWEYLRDLESWYFKTPPESRKDLQGLCLWKWPCPERLKNRFDSVCWDN